MISDLELLELLNAKFCHDLSGPIGALCNGADFLAEGKADMRKRAIILVESSVDETTAKMQFFRHAYGHSATTGEADILKLKSVTEKFFQSGKISISWPEDNGDNFAISPKIGKLLLNAILVCSQSLIYKGKISVEFFKEDNLKKIRISATSTNIKVDQETIDILSDSETQIDITSRNVQILYTKRLAEQYNVQFKLEHDADFFDIIIEMN